MPRLTFGAVTVEITDHGTLVLWPDGSFVSGAPEDTDTYRATACHCGYGADTTRLCIEHEVLHVALGHWLGVPSPVMRIVRGDISIDPALAGLEEAAVLAIQTYARAAGIDVVRTLEARS